MSENEREERVPRDKKVGYRNPPEEHRFKEGESGNPGGKKKKATSQNIPSLFKEEMDRLASDGTSMVRHSVRSEIRNGIKGSYKSNVYCLKQYGKALKEKGKSKTGEEADLEAAKRVFDLDPRCYLDVADQDNTATDSQTPPDKADDEA